MDILYTTTDQIRAVLGTTPEEIEDAQIIDLGILDILELKLLTVYPTHAALKAIIDADTATVDEKKKWLQLSLYVRYEAACCLLPQAAMLFAQKISDGDAEMQRFNKDKLQEFIDNIRGERDSYMGQVNEDLAFKPLLGGLFSVVPPAYDPVTDI